MSICKFCLQEKQLVNAHIIPRAFFEAIKSAGINTRGQRLKEFTNGNNRYPITRTTKGLYDPRLVCGDCERIFGPFDDYAIKLLLKEEEKHIPIHVNQDSIAWQIKSYDYTKLMLFFIAFLWRADKTELNQFRRIQLGSYSDIAKEALFHKGKNQIERFSILLTRFESGIGRNIIMDPYLDRGTFKNIKVYRFYLGAGYIIYIKVDKRPFPQDFDVLKVSRNQFYILNIGKFENSKDFPVVQKVYKDAEYLAKYWKDK